MQISRSAADELYNLTHSDMSVDLINVEPFVEKMLSPQNTPQNGLQNEPQKLIAQLTPRQQQIIALIRKNNCLSRQEMADKLDIAYSTIKRDLSAISHIVKYIGASKGGHWEIIE